MMAAGAAFGVGSAVGRSAVNSMVGGGGYGHDAPMQQMPMDGYQ